MAHQYTAAPVTNITVPQPAGSWSTSGTPCTMSAWAYNDTQPAGAGIMSINCAATADAQLMYTATNTLKGESLDQGVLSSICGGPSAIPTTTYYHACVTMSGTAQRVAYVN